jgi:hypothetical protein
MKAKTLGRGREERERTEGGKREEEKERKNLTANKQGWVRKERSKQPKKERGTTPGKA